jgi:hypothetical protein
MAESVNPPGLPTPKIELTEETYWHTFVCGEARGRVMANEARKLQQPPYETRPAHIEVTFENDLAWRIVRVFGTTSLKRAVQAAMAHADPPPVTRVLGGTLTYGDGPFEITLPKRIIRDRRLTPEEAVKYDGIRKQIDGELPELIAEHHKRMESK